PPCPAPQGVENGRIDMDKGFLGRRVSVKVCPTPYFGSKCGDQPVCRGRFLILDDLSDVRKERFDVLFRWACKEFPIVLTYMLSEKVKPVLNVRYAGFLFREFQPSFPQKIGDEGLDLLFQDLFRDTCDEEVVTIAHQIDLLVHTFQGLWTGVRVFLAKYPFQSVQCRISKDRTDHSPYKVANFFFRDRYHPDMGRSETRH